MLPYVILGVALGLPLIIGIFWRVNPSFVFFALMAGELLERYFGDDAELVIRTFTNGEALTPYAPIAVLLLPIIFTGFFLRGTLSKNKLFFQWVPMIITGFVLAAFALPLLPEALQEEVASVELGRQLLDSSELIVGVVVAFQLLSLWVLNKGHGGKHGSHKKHH